MNYLKVLVFLTSTALCLTIGCKRFKESGVKTANTNTVNSWIEEVYPNDKNAQWILQGYLTVLNTHTTKPPFLGGNSPGIPGFDLNKIPAGFYFNKTSKTTDLLILNWNKGEVAGLEGHTKWSHEAGRKIIIARKIPLLSLRTIDLNRGHFFQYIVWIDNV